jgi:hypothetical protein
MSQSHGTVKHEVKTRSRPSLAAVSVVLVGTLVSLSSLSTGNSAAQSSSADSLSSVRVAQINAISEGPGKAELLGFMGRSGVAYRSGSYLVVWSEQRKGQNSVLAVRVNSRGRPFEYNRILSSQGEYSAVAAGDSSYLVVWRQSCDGKTCVRGLQLTSDGRTADTAGLIISEQAAEPVISFTPPAIASDGRNFLVVWPGFKGVYGALVSAEGKVLNRIRVSEPTGDHVYDNPDVVYGGGQWLVVWNQLAQEGDLSRVYFRRLTKNGSVLESPESVSDEPGTQATPSVAYDGKDHFFAVWQQLGRDGWRIAGTRIGADGRIVDPNGISLSKPSNEPQSHPAIAFGDLGYLVVWEQQWDIRGVRVAASGNVDSAGIPVRTLSGDSRTESPRVVAGEKGYLCIWQERYSGSGRRVIGAAVLMH